MKKSRVYQFNKFLEKTIGRPIAGSCPKIQWEEIIRIEAFGTDAVSAFAIVVTFNYEDGSKVSLHPEQRGYYEIIESLDGRFAGISPDWFEEMRQEGKEHSDVHRILYSRN